MRDVTYHLEEPVTIAGLGLNQLPVYIHNYDPSLAPAGKTLLTLMIDSDYEYWKKLSEDPESYKVEKDQIAD